MIPAVVTVEDLSLVYSGADTPVLDAVDLVVRPDEFVVLTGPSGSGKSSLVRVMSGIIPHLSNAEIRRGRVVVVSDDVRSLDIHDIATHVSMVFQNPEAGLCCLRVRDELQFGPENLGLDRAEIDRRVGEVIKTLGLEDLTDALIGELSGGQKQRVAIASGLTMQPDLLILDEPTTDLDPQGKAEVVQTLKHLCRSYGIAFLAVEHDLDELVSVADRLVVIDKGSVILNGSPDEVLIGSHEIVKASGIKVPDHVTVALGLRRRGIDVPSASVLSPETVEGLFFESFGDHNPIKRGEVAIKPGKVEREERVLLFDRVTFSYNKQSPPAIDDVTFEVENGELVAILGHNGSGKSTIARLAIGLLQPQAGAVAVGNVATSNASLGQIARDTGFLFQNPDSQLFCATVREEVEFGIRKLGMGDDEISERRDNILALLDLDRYLERHPLSLSRGERQRLAAATALIHGPKLVLLDEPTTGQDGRNLGNLLELVEELVMLRGGSVVMVSHDMSVVSRHATRCLIMENGRVIADGVPPEIFANARLLKRAGLRPPFVARLTADRVGGALLTPEALEICLNGKPTEKEIEL